MNELELCRKVIDGDRAAVGEFIDRYRKPLEDYLVSKCGDSAARAAALEIAHDIMADCTSRGLLEKFKGTGSLEGWLRRVGYRLLQKHWEKERRRPDRNSLDEMEETGGSVGYEVDADKDENSIDAGVFYKKLMAATVYAFERLRQEHPDQLAILRLSELHGVRQRRIAEAFGIHEAEICKKKRDGGQFLRGEVSAYLLREFPRGSFTWADLREFVRDADEIVHDEDLGQKILGMLGSAGV